MKEFLDFDEFKALLASHGYDWGSIEADNLLYEAFYSETLTPVFFYHGLFSWGFTYFDEQLNEWQTAKEGVCTLRGHFSIYKSDLIEHFADMEDVTEKWWFGNRIMAYKTYGEPPPSMTDSNTDFGFNSRLEIGRQATPYEINKITDCFISIADDDYLLAFNELAYPIEQVSRLFPLPATSEPIISAEIERLTNELNQAKTALKQLQDASNSNDTLHPRTANNASKIIAALASELLGMNLTKPFAADTNGKIKAAIEKQGNAVSKEVIADWLKLAHENSL